MLTGYRYGLEELQVGLGRYEVYGGYTCIPVDVSHTCIHRSDGQVYSIYTASYIILTSEKSYKWSANVQPLTRDSPRTAYSYIHVLRYK